MLSGQLYQVSFICEIGYREKRHNMPLFVHLVTFCMFLSKKYIFMA